MRKNLIQLNCIPHLCIELPYTIYFLDAYCLFKSVLLQSYSKKKIKVEVFESVIKSLFPFEFRKYTDDFLFDKPSDENVYSIGEALVK